ncbi:MAG: hypothetical protein AAGF74_11820 [Pseudomonadota bacterium]
MSFRLLIKSLPATLLFGYALIANVTVFQEGGWDLGDAGLMGGEATSMLDRLYAEDLPHRDPSINLIGASRYLLLKEGRAGVVVGQRNWLFSDEEFRFAESAPVSLPDSVVGIARVSEQLAQRGIELVLLPLPAKVDIERSHIGDAAIPERSAQEYTEFFDALSDAGLHVLDTRPSFGTPDAPRFFKTDTHWTTETTLSVAMSLAGSGLIAKGDTEFRKVPQTPEVFTGDLVSFVTGDGMAAKVGLPPEVVESFVAEKETGGALDLFAASETFDVVLIGTSYSADARWSFEEALKLFLGHDVLNLSEKGRGPVAPMLDFLGTGLAALESPPQVVIWEFPVRYLADPALWPEGSRDA